MVKYTNEIAEIICRRLANGESVNAICKDDLMPAESTVRLWALEKPEFIANTRAHA